MRVQSDEYMMGCWEVMKEGKIIENKLRRWNELPGEKGSAVTSVFSSSTGFRVSLPIWLNCIDLWTLLTLPFLLPMFPTEVFLDSCKIAKGPWGMVVDTCGLRANIGFLFYLFAVSLLQLPWKVVASPVELKVLISLKPFVADLTDKSIGSK